MTRSERQADAIAKRLVKALRGIESFADDPEMIFDSANVEAHRDNSGIKDALYALRRHYIED